MHPAHLDIDNWNLVYQKRYKNKKTQTTRVQVLFLQFR